MTQNTKIEWADHTFNPWWGCTKISPACDNCYAQALDKRTGGDHWGANQPRKRTSAKNWLEPVKWNKQPYYECLSCGWRGCEKDSKACEHGHGYPHRHCPNCNTTESLSPARARVFCASMADVFDNEIPSEWFDDLMRMIRDTPQLDWLLLTKRIGNAQRMLDGYCDRNLWVNTWAEFQAPPKASTLGYQNIWLGATICNQEEADRDIPKLLDVPAAMRFLSIEPMLGAIDLCELEAGGVDETIIPRKYWTDVDDDDSHPALVIDALTGWQHQRLGDWTQKGESVDWIICGGESGHGARPMHPDWARSLRDQCKAADVPFFFKQWGEWREPMPDEEFDTSLGRAAKPPAFILSESGTVRCFKSDDIINGKAMIKVGKKSAGRVLDGVEHNGVPVLATNA